MFKVLTLKPMDQIGIDMLEKADCRIFTSAGAGEKDFIRDIEEIRPDALFVRTDPVTRAMIDACDTLKVVAKQGVGIDNIDVDYCTEKNIQVVFAPGGNANAVAEHTIMLMLMCAERYRYVDKQMRRGNFEVRYTLHNTVELKGMTLGLLGCGRIGQMVARIASTGFGMKVIGYDPYPPKNPLVHIEMMERDEVLKNADFISLHMPSLPSTVHTIGYEQFSLMKPSAIFVNCSRGDIIIENDLIKALNDGKFLGAGMDVFEHEPLEMENPLLGMTRVVATPHTAASTVQSVENCTQMACQSIIEVLYGENVSYPANRISRPA